MMRVEELIPGVRLEVFDRERKAAIFDVDRGDDRFDLMVLLERFRRVFDALGPGDVGDVDQAVDAVFYLDKRAEVGQVADAAFDPGSDAIAIRERLPRVRLDLLDAEADAPVVRIDFEHLRLDLLTDRKELRWVFDALRPRHLRDVHEAFDARLDLDERAVIGDRDHLAFDARAYRESLDRRRPWVGDQLFVAKADALFVAVELEHLDLDVFADLEEFVRILDAAPGHVGYVEQAVQPAEVDERAVFGDVLDLALDDDALFEVLES